MKIVTVETLQGYNYEVLGIVEGSTIQSKNMFTDLGQGLKGIVGGELKGYTELLQETRDEALKRMEAEASAIGANAVLNVRLSTASITSGAAEVFAYGAAVVLAPAQR